MGGWYKVALAWYVGRFGVVTVVQVQASLNVGLGLVCRVQSCLVSCWTILF